MKNIILIILVLSSNKFVFSQIVNSSCNAPDSIKALYKNDADRLALRKIFRQNLAYKDSVVIPQLHSDTIMNALIAVYNSTSLPARDTVISTFDIHSFPYPSMNSLIVAADSTFPWMQQLKMGIIPTGNSQVDDIITDYNLNLGSYSNFGNSFYYHVVVFSSNDNYNISALGSTFSVIPGVYFTENNGFSIDGNEIEDSVYNDHVELIYSYAWGDCYSGCMYRRYWKFNVYFDCSVEYAGSYGAQLEFAGIDEIQENNISVFPNPFTSSIFVKGVEEAFDFSILNVMGQTVLKGNSANGLIDNLSELKEEIYFLQIVTNEKYWTVKIVRK